MWVPMQLIVGAAKARVSFHMVESVEGFAI